MSDPKKRKPSKLVTHQMKQLQLNESLHCVICEYQSLDVDDLQLRVVDAGPIPN